MIRDYILHVNLKQKPICTTKDGDETRKPKQVKNICNIFIIQ